MLISRHKVKLLIMRLRRSRVGLRSMTLKYCAFFTRSVITFRRTLTRFLEISKSGLKVITQDDLRPFPKLKTLWLNFNNLVSLESNLFYFNPQLKIINFNNNRIRSVSYDILDPVDEPSEIYFINNICISREGKSREDINKVEREIIEKCQPMRNEICEIELATLKRKLSEIL